VECPPARIPGRSKFAATIGAVTGELIYDGPHAELRLAGKPIADVSGIVRLLTTTSGELHAAVGTAENESVVTMQLPGRRRRTLRIAPNQRLDLRAASA